MSAGLAAPLIRPRVSVTRSMALTGLALLPGTLLSTLLFGSGVLLSLLACMLGAAASEAAVLALRRRPLGTLSDGSALLSGALLGLSLPPDAPLWLPLSGAAVAMTLGKHLYGGLGRNPFNPAMLAYVVLLLCWPQAMTRWPVLDAASGATVLDTLRNGLQQGLLVGEIAQAGTAPRSRLWLACAWTAGGLLLLATRTIRWQIPAGVLAGLLLPALFAHAVDADRHAPASLHLLSGATLFAAWFIATDPVTAATTPRGRLLFGAGIGLLAWLIRRYGDYPDGFAFAVLLMNLCVPWMDRYTQPRPMGRSRLPCAPVEPPQ